MTNMSNKFEADTGKILDIVINSLYSEREIFLRELVSNASDALDKRKYLGLTNKKIDNSSATSEIKIEVNSKEKTLTKLPRSKKIKPGFYRVNISCHEENFKKIFAFSPKNTYTHTSLQHAIKHQKTFNVKIDLYSH